MLEFIRKAGGQYVRRDIGLGIAFPGEIVSLNLRSDNIPLAGLLLQACGITITTQLGKAIIVRLMVHAEKVAAMLQYYSLSAASLATIHLPTKAGRLLAIRAEGLSLVDNGRNSEGHWVEHPFNDGLGISDISELPDAQAIQSSLDLFESLVVHSQACTEPAMSWLVALNGCVVPFVRGWLTARFILVHTGASQSGKTTGARRLIRFHGLRDVHGDVSVAALSNGPDTGFAALDNREQCDIDRPLQNYLLYLATGAVRARSDVDGNVKVQSARPITHITTIEGINVDELRRRCIEVEYAICSSRFDSEGIDAAISQHRTAIVAAFAFVLQRLLQVRLASVGDRDAVPEMASGFGAHYQLLCDVLRSYGAIRKRPESWAESIVAQWFDVLSRKEEAESALEQLIVQVAQRGDLGPSSEMDLNGCRGRLYCTDAGSLLSCLRTVTDDPLALPKSPTGLGRRVRGDRFAFLKFVDPEVAPQRQELRRSGHRRPIGLFLPEDSANVPPTHESTAWPSKPTSFRELDRRLLSQHSLLASGDEVRFLWEYSPGDRSPAERFINAFKSRVNPSAPNSAKQMAIEFGARAVAAALPVELRGWAFVPMPSSGGVVDDRLGRMLRLVVPRLDVREGLLQLEPNASCLKGVSVAERLNNLGIGEGLLGTPPPGIVLVDDVISSGCHVRAARMLLQRHLPAVPVVSLVLVRRAVAALSAAASG